MVQKNNSRLFKIIKYKRRIKEVFGNAIQTLMEIAKNDLHFFKGPPYLPSLSPLDSTESNDLPGGDNSTF